jgi:L-ascorbate metabolism protein UlaG (beta-lactamase superfamily)
LTGLRVTHIGGPTVLLELGGWRLLTDPTFDSPGRRYPFGWGSSSRKLTGPAIPASELPPIDAVLLTHDHHGDNLDDVRVRAGSRRHSAEHPVAAGRHAGGDEC